jgi:predicted SnoaL-like aldol condensation-catalyzing enzyme
MTSTSSKELVKSFIENIWNQNRFEEVNKYLAVDFMDHSLPPHLPRNADGLKLWVIGTGKSFVHKTIIDEMVCEENKVIVKIRMQMKHIGTWRGIEPTNAEIYTVGYRYFKLADSKIIEHYALIDGNAIENRLKDAAHACKIQE